ncbi:hypothetical protein SLA2020_278100 [Shorea laevis]
MHHHGWRRSATAPKKPTHHHRPATPPDLPVSLKHTISHSEPCPWPSLSLCHHRPPTPPPALSLGRPRRAEAIGSVRGNDCRSTAC